MKKMSMFAITLVALMFIISTGTARAQYQATPEQIKLGTAHWKNGIEHPLIRQLIAKPAIVDSTTFEFKGDRNDASAVKHWADTTAHLLAIRAGYVDAQFGGEVRVTVGDKLAYVIQKTTDNKVVIAEYAVPAASQTATSNTATTTAPVTPTATHNVVAIVAAAQFFGVTSEGKPARLPAYEYAYLG
jgi:hypothetical protein